MISCFIYKCYYIKYICHTLSILMLLQVTQSYYCWVYSHMIVIVTSDPTITVVRPRPLTSSSLSSNINVEHFVQPYFPMTTRKQQQKEGHTFKLTFSRMYLKTFTINFLKTFTLSCWKNWNIILFYYLLQDCSCQNNLLQNCEYEQCLFKICYFYIVKLF